MDHDVLKVIEDSLVCPGYARALFYVCRYSTVCGVDSTCRGRDQEAAREAVTIIAQGIDRQVRGFAQGEGGDKILPAEVTKTVGIQVCSNHSPSLPNGYLPATTLRHLVHHTPLTVDAFTSILPFWPIDLERGVCHTEREW